MPTFGDTPDTGTGSGQGGSGSTVGGITKGIATPGSPLNKSVLELVKSSFQQLLNEHGLPATEADEFKVLQLTVGDVFFQVVNSGQLNVSASGLVLPYICGRTTLAAGSGIVLTPLIGVGTNVLLTTQIPVNPGFVYVSARTAGVSFTVQSSNVSDASVVAWLLVDST